MKFENETTSLAAMRSGTLSKRAGLETVGALEKALLERFPASTAEDWDRTGLLVGDPAETLRKVAVALDPTVEAVRAAKAAGANVLLTHHPVFLDPPDAFHPASSRDAGPGAVVWTAVREGVALMDFHTALDVSREAQRVLPGMLGLQLVGLLEPVDGERGLGYGQSCVPKVHERPLTLRQLAARCTSVFGRPPRVWGDFDREMHSVVTTTGSAGSMWKRCTEAGVSAIVCGEIKYHDALNASSAGLCIIDLGHDTSELPLCSVLVDALVSLGVKEDEISLIEQNDNWSHPEAVRR